MEHFTKQLGFTLIAMLTLLAAGQQADESAQATDMLFIGAASQSNVYEIGAARHVVQEAESQEVKELAQRIIDDHTKAASQLLQVAEGLEAEPNSDVTDAQQLKLNALSELSGAELETAYLEQQVLAHQEAISLFETASSMVQAQELTTFIEETLPVLEEHLQMAQEAMQASGGSN